MTAETPQAVNGCGSRHLKLACWIIGMAIVAVFAVGKLATSSSADLDRRVRATEITQAETTTKLDAIHETLKGMEQDLKALARTRGKESP